MKRQTAQCKQCHYKQKGPDDKPGQHCYMFDKPPTHPCGQRKVNKPIG